MSSRSRFGFTLAELLVVIVIIAILVGLLVPAVIGARAAARQKQCMNYQKELGLAVAQYETAKDYYPGYVNPKNLSWLIAVFEPLGEGQLWKEWRDGDPTLASGEKAIVTLRQLVCPDDFVRDGPLLSYVGNSGVPGDDGAPKASGIFHNRSGDVSPMPEVSSSDIVDGAQHTLLISERLSTQVPDPDEPRLWTDFTEDRVGFTWFGEGTTVTDHVSSNHRGGVNVMFCDNHGRFIRDSISYHVYTLLMTPNGNGLDPPQGPWGEDDIP